MFKLQLYSLVFLFWTANSYASQPCTYTYSVWNTQKHQTVKTITVSKQKQTLTSQEIGPFGCTLCQEDQTEILLNNKLTLTLCKEIADKTKTALNKALDQGGQIISIKGYRPSKSRGPIDKNGNRTLFSNHAYGVALDINENFNGLYTNCPNWSPNCQLVKGGRYRPKNPLALTKNHPIVIQLQKIGLNWGGSLTGSMKDFMHFSPDGK